MKLVVPHKYHSSFMIILFCGLGLVLSVLLQKSFSVPGFAASALVGLLGSFLPNSKLYDNKKLIAAVYAGSFASMSSLEYFESNQDLWIVCLLTGVSFIGINSFFKGYGGKLGTIGFVASLIFVSFKVLL